MDVDLVGVALYELLPFTSCDQKIPLPVTVTISQLVKYPRINTEPALFNTALSCHAL